MSGYRRVSHSPECRDKTPVARLKEIEHQPYDPMKVKEKVANSASPAATNFATTSVKDTPADSSSTTHIATQSASFKKTKRGALVNKLTVQKSPRPMDPSVYKDMDKVWTEKELAWQNPIRGENGIGRVIFNPSTKSIKRYIFCINHGWLTINESPHSTSECKAFRMAMNRNVPFVSRNPDVRIFLETSSQ